MSNSDHLPRSIVVEDPSCAAEARQFSPSAARNRGPIREVLNRVLPKKGLVLEIGSGTGEHAVCFAKALPRLVWLPSDPDVDSRASIEAWIATEQLANVRAPVDIDVRHETWDVEDDAPFDAMISLNMIHIAPWTAAVGLLAGAGRLLSPDGVLFLYGPFMRGGVHTAASNAAFDADLKRRDKRWGVRDVDELVSEAAPYGIELREVVKMPANNLSLIFVKANLAHHSTAADTDRGLPN
jgi:SAM-dependent methyltransferase